MTLDHSSFDAIKADMNRCRDGVFCFRFENGSASPPWSMRTANPIDWGCEDGAYHMDLRIRYDAMDCGGNTDARLKLQFLPDRNRFAYYNGLVTIRMTVELADRTKNRLDENLRGVFA